MRWSRCAAMRRAARRTSARLRRSSTTVWSRRVSLEHDVGRVNDLLSAFFPCGLLLQDLHVAAHRPWKSLYEPLIRRAAGLGFAMPDPDRYAHRYAHCDVLVVGAGPAGIAATLAAAEVGSRVILCDEQAEFGGSLLADNAARIDGEPARTWVQQSIRALAQNPRVTPLPAPRLSATSRTTSWD